MSTSKKDRTTAPRTGSRASRAKHIDDRNVAPPAGYRPVGKPKPGERAMEGQLVSADPVAEQCSRCGRPSSSTCCEEPPSPSAVTIVATDPDDLPSPKDPWWTGERERAFVMTLQGVPQHQVAAELGRDRHTVARWAEDDRFTQRLFDENASRFRASRQRRAMQTVRLTDKAEYLAGKMLDKAIELANEGEDQLGTRLAARDWLQEYRENSRREDEIYGVAGARVDVSVHGAVQHQHKGRVDVSFKAFLTTSLRNMGVDPDSEEIDAGRADEALAAITERALLEGAFLDDLVEREKNQLAPVLQPDRRNPAGQPGGGGT